ncbi:MAG: dehydrogenase [Candidatus Methanogaster sp.]|uniref:Dehydrogenase n=1 Tax=Candidatus Methanogaster sp. TaxID=3386292 RepID=A0AC61L1F6_9EURY|nr:MAG: dehydrogenase [ANME-2 cluster archaeon]
MINKILNAVVALLFLAVVGMSVMGTYWVEEPLTFTDNDSSGIVTIGTEIFTTYVVAFEVLALVLLAALIGGIYLAKEDEEEVAA